MIVGAPGLAVPATRTLSLCPPTSTIVGGPTWNKLSDADKKIFAEVLGEAAARATAQIVEVEQKLGAEFSKRGKEVVKVDRTAFRDAVAKLHNGPDATWDKATYDKLQALK